MSSRSKNKLQTIITADLKQQFWQDKLANVEIVDLKFLQLAPDENSKTNELYFEFDGQTFERVVSISTKFNIRPYLYGQIIFAYLLHRHTSQEVFTINCPDITFKNKQHNVHINIVPYNFARVTYFEDIINQQVEFIKSLQIFEKEQHHITSIHNPDNLADVAFVESDVNNNQPTNFGSKLCFEHIIDNKLISVKVSYDATNINKELLTSFINCYQRIYREILSDLLKNRTQKLLVDYSLLDKEEYNKIVYEWNKTDKPFPENKTIHQLFEEQVEKTPNNIAVVFENTQLTYNDLNNKSNQLAHYLINNYKIKPDDLIALCLERSELIIVAILAVLKAGGAYVPIDPSFPDERINYILNDTQAKVLITNDYYLSGCHSGRSVNIPDHDSFESRNPSDYHFDTDTNPTYIHSCVGRNPCHQIIAIDSPLFINKLEKQKISSPKIKISSKNLAYVIYTSGTTGKPKGVMIEHRSVSNLIVVQSKELGLTINGNRLLKKFLWYSDYAFDAHVWDIYIAILQGHIIHVLNNEIRQSLPLLSKYILKHNINIATIPPAILTLDNILKLDILIVAGETPNRKILDKYLEHNTKLINAYGLTECTVCTSLNRYETNRQVSIIGKAIANTKYYVLNNTQNALPIGVIGELYISGIGVSRGYVNSSKLTQERFIFNPFQTKEEKLKGVNFILYKTGDLVRMLPDGCIEYIGRNDTQVKIRGYRIELSEIEAILNNFIGIKQSVVIPMSHKNRLGHFISDDYLVGYYVSENKLVEEAILNFLKEYLPNYMVPNQLIHINKLPLTFNGKIDTKALPEPILFSDSTNILASKDMLEQKIVEIWADILKVPSSKIGITDSFFKLGGNSILIKELKNKLSNLNELKFITTTDLFKYTSIEQITDFIRNDQEDLKDQITDSNKFDNEIAIISISGAFSGCNNIEEYWELIKSGQESIKCYTLDECNMAGVNEELVNNPNFIAASGHIADVDKFDATFWGIAPSVAKLMDPQIRKFLEHCWYVLEESGYLNLRSQLQIGVFAGCGDNKYVSNFVGAKQRTDPSLWEAVHFNSKDAIATQTSYFLGLTGPSNSINTACSTSLVTIVEACKNLAGKYCDMALAGGVSLLMPQDTGYVYNEGMILSSDGHCRVFDADSSGTVMSSGVGVVLLKRLADAQRDNDNIIAVIKGYATNNDGNRKLNYTSPSIIGQTECILNAWKMAGIKGSVDYIECHGTGTRLGDPIEIKALQTALQQHNANSRIQHACTIGSVKANIGHTDSAAGVAGVIKVCKMLENNTIPTQINFKNLNPDINLHKTNFKISTKSIPWIKDKPKVVGVSAFGIGGTNAHIIITNYTNKKTSEAKVDNLNYIIPISAKSIFSLNAYKKDLIKYLINTSDKIEDIAFTLQLKRQEFKYRLAIVCNSREDAVRKLQIAKKVVKVKCLSRPRKHNVIFMFPGQGAQYVNMSINLYKNDTTYRSILDSCIEIINKQQNIHFEKVLFPDLHNDASYGFDINETKWAQPALFIISYSLAKLLETLNIEASAFIGLSVGELVAATLSGVFTIEDAIKIVWVRGNLMQNMLPGSMLSIQAKMDGIEKIIYDNNCEIAVINTPNNITVSGEKKAIDALKAQLDKYGIVSVILNVSHAYHSHLMNDAASKFLTAFKDVKLNIPNKPFISNVTGTFITKENAISPDYWASHIRKSVLLSDGIKTLLNYYDDPFFIEIGAGKTVTSFAKQIIGCHKEIAAISLLYLNQYSVDNKMELTTIKEDILSLIWANGYNVNFETYYKYLNNRKIVKLPKYHFDNLSCWINQTVSGSIKDNDMSDKFLPKDKWLNTQVWKKSAKLPHNRYCTYGKKFLIFKNKDYTNFNCTEFNDKNVIFINIDYNIKSFAYINESTLSINPSEEIAYINLAEYLQNSIIEPNVIVHAITLTSGNESNKLIDMELNASFYSLFLIQKYILGRATVDTKLVVLTQEISQITNADNINPYNGTLVGALRTIKHEFTLQCCIIDVGINATNDTLLQAFNLVDYNQIFTNENLYSIRFDSLWEESLEPVKLPIITNDTIMDKDVILITGGLGGVGLAIANQISKKNKAIFILVSRTNLSDILEKTDYVNQQLTIIENIKSQNCLVDIKCIDITEPCQLNQLFDYIYKTYNKLSGIIHAAGSPPLSAHEKSYINVKASIRAKVYGAANLVNKIKNLDIKYFIMVSSLASIMGDINQIEYSAANSYLDYLSVSKNFPYGCMTIVINWCVWLDVGMLVYKKTQNNFKNIDFLVSNAIASNEASELFYNLIQQNTYSQIIVSKLDIELLKSCLFGTNTMLNVADNGADAENKVIEKNLPELYYQVGDMFSNILGVKKVSIFEDFFELGGTSLSAIKLLSQLKAVGIRVTLADMSNLRTIDKICKVNNSRKAVNIVYN